ncbi:secretion-regulating guanine nucleotide exchange factor [Thrips palmi]|uniref:Secretion-regulating guanine nucleotide exchange factor n=1 Tax=Thrips palmi TaxID=161013 RepID=A0A6P8Y306_THRPL|nr:secretion-regulating guanine nucleotide exchange factor [Thrips palmi]
MKLFSWGANSHGQLGQGSISEACCLPTEISASCMDPASIVSIVGGGGHSLVLDRSGNVFAAGWNNKGQLGLEGDDVTSFQSVQSLHGYRVNQLACGWDSSSALTSNGSLLVWGSNAYSQLGLSKQKLKSTKSPQRIPVARVKQASLGLRHLVIVSEAGKVYASGAGNKGQLGIVDSSGRPLSESQNITQVPFLDDIVGISCGQHHNIALSKSGKIFVWGDNRFGQLGLDPAIHPVVYTPHELQISLPEIKGLPSALFAGWTHSVVLTDNEELINWGRNSYGQLGCDSQERVATWDPSILRMDEKLRQVAVGSEHNVVLTEKRDILSWGWNEHGNCGTGAQENVLKPSIVRMESTKRATMIGTGACHCFVVLDTN